MSTLISLKCKEVYKKSLNLLFIVNGSHEMLPHGVLIILIE